MNTPAIIALLAQGRDSQPVKRPKGRAEYTESVAFQTRNDDEAWKPWAEPNREHHDLTLRFCTFDCDILQDDNYQFHTQKSLSSIYLVCLDEHPRLPIGGFRTLNIYVPEPSLGDIVESGDSVSSAAPTGSIDPRAVPDWQLRRLEVEMLAEMRMARPLSRLRIDTLGLEVAVHLLRQHSSMNGAVRWESSVRAVAVSIPPSEGRSSTWNRVGPTISGWWTWLARRSYLHASSRLLLPRQRVCLPTVGSCAVVSNARAKCCSIRAARSPRSPLRADSTPRSTSRTRFRKQIGCTPSAYRRERLS